MKTPSPKQLEQAISDTAAVGRVRESGPDLDSLKSEFKDNLSVSENPDGTKKIVLNDHTSDKRLLHRLDSMFSERNDRDCDLGAELHARHPEVVMREPNGRERRVREEFQEAFERKSGARRPGQRFLTHRADPRHAQRCAHCGEFRYWCECT